MSLTPKHDAGAGAASHMHVGQMEKAGAPKMRIGILQAILPAAERQRSLTGSVGCAVLPDQKPLLLRPNGSHMASSSCSLTERLSFTIPRLTTFRHGFDGRALACLIWSYAWSCFRPPILLAQGSYAPMHLKIPHDSNSQTAFLPNFEVRLMPPRCLGVSQAGGCNCGAADEMVGAAAERLFTVES